ncbi:hypothetical protein DH2020_041489 [Rehmannia glutinosa]|uniref:serine O-acetyltransferase n=1 Tax=Rehmannia glutinosa TaxID=99300 RepID=A0ABR0UQR5_REHGL
MATCILKADSFNRFIRLCKPTSPSDLEYSCNIIYQYAFCTDNNKFKDSCKISPQEHNDDHIWLKIRQEAEIDAIQEPILSEFYNSAILSHTSLESALANHLAIKLSNAILSRDALFSVFFKELIEDACQAHRLAHKFWAQGRTVLALLVQNRVSEVFAVDIHPGAKIGRGIVFDHATGIVIGETAVIGDNVTILHNVTLGGTGKVGGDRHPKIGDGVVIGAGAKVLGNVRVGEDAKIGAGSVVLKEVPARATAVGNPARVVGLR